MDPTPFSTAAVLTVAVLGVVVGAVVAWLATRAAQAARVALAGAERDILRERVHDLEHARAEERETAALLSPLRETILRVERQVGDLERDRLHQYGELGARLTEVSSSTSDLREQTASLAGALSASTVRGAWGELQLRRVLELSGLLPRCDFDEQVTSVSRHGSTIRPDAVVNLPGSRHVVVDSKAPLSHFLAAQGDGVGAVERAQLLSAHATSLRRHVGSLASES